MIEVKNLTKYYGKHLAVKDISFKVEQSEILGFLGPNGAGKSTTMKMLTSYIMPTSGEAKINGVSAITDSIKTRSMIGYLPENPSTYKEMKVNEFLNFVADIRGYKESSAKRRVKEIVELTYLEDVYNQTIETLSKGYKQRVGFAQALLHDPSVLILDEPTVGLDPNQKFVVRNLIKEISKKKTIILSTHILDEMEALCTRVLIINNGKIIADGAVDDLLKNSDEYNAIKLSFSNKLSKEVITKIQKAKFIDKVELSINFEEITIYPQKKEIILDKIWSLLNNLNLVPINLEVVKPHMDKVFRQLTNFK